MQPPPLSSVQAPTLVPVALVRVVLPVVLVVLVPLLVLLLVLLVLVPVPMAISGNYPLLLVVLVL
jgi:hypothetical protein